MKKNRKYLVGLVFSLLLVGSASCSAAEVYLVYSGQPRHIENQIQKSLPHGVTVKTYNTYLLALADYTGKQKVVAKLLQADVIVFLDKQAKDVLAGAGFSNVVYGMTGNVHKIVRGIEARIRKGAH